MTAADELDLEQLDPGIRQIVKLLRSRGWRTTDSGDGVSKFSGGDAAAEWAGAEECLIPEPHVIVSPAASHRWADYLHQDIVPFITTEAAERLRVDFSYSSKDKLGVLIVFGVSDSDLIAPI